MKKTNDNDFLSFESASKTFFTDVYRPDRPWSGLPENSISSEAE